MKLSDKATQDKNKKPASQKIETDYGGIPSRLTEFSKMPKSNGYKAFKVADKKASPVSPANN